MKNLLKNIKNGKNKYIFNLLQSGNISEYLVSNIKSSDLPHKERILSFFR